MLLKVKHPLKLCTDLTEMSPHRVELKDKILECFGKQTLLQHLLDPDGWKAFHEFMESEYCGENTRFWQAVCSESSVLLTLK